MITTPAEERRAARIKNRRLNYFKSNNDQITQEAFETELIRVLQNKPQGSSEQNLVYAVMYHHPSFGVSFRMVTQAFWYLEEAKLIYKGSNNRWYAI